MIRSLPIWFKLLCLLPFLVGTLLPAGLMPVASSNGMLTLVICTVDGPLELSLPTSEDETEHSRDWCPYSLHSAPDLAPGLIRTVERFGFTKIEPVVEKKNVVVSIDIASHRSRGPPATL